MLDGKVICDPRFDLEKVQDQHFHRTGRATRSAPTTAPLIMERRAVGLFLERYENKIGRNLFLG